MNGSIPSPMAQSYPSLQCRAAASAVPVLTAVSGRVYPGWARWGPSTVVYRMGQGQYIRDPGQYNEAWTNNIINLATFRPGGAFQPKKTKTVNTVILVLFRQKSPEDCSADPKTRLNQGFNEHRSI